MNPEMFALSMQCMLPPSALIKSEPKIHESDRKSSKNRSPSISSQQKDDEDLTPEERERGDRERRSSASKLVFFIHRSSLTLI